MTEQRPQWNNDGLWPNMVTTNSLEGAESAGFIPDLKDSLDLALKGEDNLYMTRFMVALPRAHMAPQFVLDLYAELTRNGLPHYVFTHESTRSAKEKDRLIGRHAKEIMDALGILARELPDPLKTITLRYKEGDRPRHILVSAVGDFELDKEDRRTIAQEVGVSNTIMKAAAIVTDQILFPPTIMLGLIPGIVSPIIEPHLCCNIRGVYYRQPNPDKFIELAVSPIDSLVLRADDFTRSMTEYAKTTYHGYDVRERPSHIFLSNGFSSS